ncbi:bacterioferritin-associated ferredoxin [Dongia sp.]|uniref:(2Fe-2S)-binding protein n=1 Tax=Dongia sp. TaxID=1977262 RepID=UPI0035AFE420
MYVCICNGYRDSEIEQTARAGGLTSPHAVYAALGSAPCCGSCLPMAQEIIDGTHQKASNDTTPLPLAAE